MDSVDKVYEDLLYYQVQLEEAQQNQRRAEEQAEFYRIGFETYKDETRKWSDRAQAVLEKVIIHIDRGGPIPQDEARKLLKDKDILESTDY